MDIKTTDGTLQVEGGDLALVTEQNAIGQDIKSAYQTWKGEYFLDKTVGIDYIKEFLIKNYRPGLIEARLKNLILSRPGVISITYFDTDIDKATRKLTVTATVNTISGNINITEVL
jgi:hypothetical protein